MRVAWVLLCVVGLSGLDINESVQKVLNKSQKVQEQKHLLSKLQAQLGIYQGAYYPKIDLSNESAYKTSNRLQNKSSLQINTNLFNGMQDYYLTQMQDKNIQAQSEEINRVKEEVKYAIKKLYTQILLAKGRLEISKESEKLLQIQLAQAKQFYKQGISAKNNVLSVEVSLASAKLEINSYTTQLHYLLSTLELFMEEPVELNSLQDLPPCEYELSYDRLSLVVFEYHPQYRSLLHQKQALEYEIASTKGAYYPKINLGIGGEVVEGYESYAQASLSLGISLNLFNGLRDSYAIESKQSSLLALNSKIQSYKKEILTQLQQSIGDFNLAKAQYILSQKSVQSAQENYRIVYNRYKQNLESTSTLLDAELMLKVAKANLLQAQYETWQNLFYVESLMGREARIWLD